MEDGRQRIRQSSSADLSGLDGRGARSAAGGPDRIEPSPAGLNTRSAYLTSITAALAEALAGRFGDRFGPQVRLRPCPGRLCPWEAFFDSLGTAGGSFALSPAGQADAPPAVVGLTAEAADPLVSALLGSRRPEAHCSNRPPSPIQRRLLRTLVLDIAEALGEAVAHAPAGPYEWDVPAEAPEGDRDALAGGQAAVMRLSVELNRRSGAILLAVDSSLLPAEGFAGPQNEVPEAPVSPEAPDSSDSPDPQSPPDSNAPPAAWCGGAGAGPGRRRAVDLSAGRGRETLRTPGGPEDPIRALATEPGHFVPIVPRPADDVFEPADSSDDRRAAVQAEPTKPPTGDLPSGPDRADQTAGHAPSAPAVEFAAEVDGGELDARELAALSAGDVVLSDAEVNGAITVYVNGRPAWLARLGRMGDRRALRLLRRLDADDSDLSTETR